MWHWPSKEHPLVLTRGRAVAMVLVGYLFSVLLVWGFLIFLERYHELPEGSSFPWAVFATVLLSLLSVWDIYNVLRRPRLDLDRVLADENLQGGPCRGRL